MALLDIQDSGCLQGPPGKEKLGQDLFLGVAFSGIQFKQTCLICYGSVCPESLSSPSQGFRSLPAF